MRVFAITLLMLTAFSASQVLATPISESDLHQAEALLIERIESREWAADSTAHELLADVYDLTGRKSLASEQRRLASALQQLPAGIHADRVAKSVDQPISSPLALD
ncbi:MAG: hypothetical protein K2W95_34675 [Candidatus Obscuribacterales bacterium]|nr:hypothetical protein [Candidatus Obscuribacterales bacterium]